MGQALHMVEAEEVEDTPLQVRLEALAETIGKFGTIAGALTVLVLSVMWFMNPVAAGEVRQYTDLVRFFIVGVTIVVVAVPEGLPLAVTISLAFSMRRMMRNNILVRELQACETMGSATVIATDKTGALQLERFGQ
jgi:P-type Ca2+ transporter type 2C